MSLQSDDHSEVSMFSFQRLYNGLPVEVTIGWLDGQHSIFIDKALAAKIRLDDDGQTWIVTDGELDDPNLVKEIGERIESNNR